jgi:hypothetical protein
LANLTETYYYNSNNDEREDTCSSFFGIVGGIVYQVLLQLLGDATTTATIHLLSSPHKQQR